MIAESIRAVTRARDMVMRDVLWQGLRRSAELHRKGMCSRRVVGRRFVPYWLCGAWEDHHDANQDTLEVL